jgi:hypothetical protein
MAASDTSVQSIVRNLQAQPALPYQLDMSVKYHLDNAAAMSGGADAKRMLPHLTTFIHTAFCPSVNTALYSL